MKSDLPPAEAAAKIEMCGLKVTDGTQDLTDFMAIFAPMAVKDALGQKLRKANFSFADPNGNGLCSLAEIENFILQCLLEQYPKDKSKKDAKGDPLERGRDLFDAFRPCYIRAYTDAKDIMPDNGEALDGTKDSTADDFLSWGEFRYMNIYLCAYGAMYDAFAKVDGALEGASSGRDGDDLRMEKAEWLAGYKSIAGGYGFVGLAADKLGDDTAAMKVFGAIDDNGGGIVLMDEWSEYIKKCEIDGGTALGKNLAFEVGADGKPVAVEATKAAAKAKAPPAPAKTKGAAAKPPKPPATATKTPWPKILAWFREKRWRAVALKQMFTDLDTDNSGDVDLQELVGGMKEMGLELTDDEFLAFFHDLDANGDGAITRKEFTDAIAKAVASDPAGMK